MKCFYHSDADGICSAHILKCYNNAEKLRPNMEFYPISYNEKFPIENIKKNEQVWILDFSIPVEDMILLQEKTRDIIWIDHHQTAIDKYANFKKHIHGDRDSKFAGCLLTQRYLFGDHVEVPNYIQYVADRDIWIFDFKESKPFHQAFLLKGQPGPEDPWWDSLLIESNLRSEVYKGLIAIEMSQNINKVACEKYSYETDFEGYKVLACNTTSRTSDLFGEKFNDYDFVLPYTFDGENFIVSIYSSKMDVVEIAKKYGGGGHLRACGFVCKDLPFKPISKKVKTNHIKELLPHQQRVVEETKELDIKIENLVKFLSRPDINEKVDDEEIQRLQYQLECMVNYASVLGHRIVAFLKEKE
jgi:oligoribonuclease NrnB/cAMP/cGMP phosphodiesterase (DHH superfamily)